MVKGHISLLLTHPQVPSSSLTEPNQFMDKEAVWEYILTEMQKYPPLHTCSRGLIQMC